MCIAPRWLAPNVSACSSCSTEAAASPGNSPIRLQRRIPAGAAQRHQPERAEPRDQRRAAPEQHDLGDDPLGPQNADHRVGEAELAPIERAEPVIELMAGLQRRRADDEQPEPRDRDKRPKAGQRGAAALVAASPPRRPCSTGSRGRRRPEQPRRQAPEQHPVVRRRPRAAGMTASAAPLPTAARMKLTEPHTRTRP